MSEVAAEFHPLIAGCFTLSFGSACEELHVHRPSKVIQWHGRIFHPSPAYQAADGASFPVA